MAVSYTTQKWHCICAYIWHVMGQILHQSQEALYVIERPGASPFTDALYVVERPGVSPFTDALHFISICVYSSVIYYMTKAFQSL